MKKNKPATVTFTLRLTKLVRDKAVKLADGDRRSLNWFVETATIEKIERMTANLPATENA